MNNLSLHRPVEEKEKEKLLDERLLSKASEEKSETKYSIIASKILSSFRGILIFIDIPFLLVPELTQ